MFITVHTDATIHALFAAHDTRVRAEWIAQLHFHWLIINNQAINAI
jgi:hypothetical protein